MKQAGRTKDKISPLLRFDGALQHSEQNYSVEHTANRAMKGGGMRIRNPCVGSFGFRSWPERPGSSKSVQTIFKAHNS